MKEEQKDNPSAVNPEVEEMRRGWEIVHDVYEGTLCLRDKAATYLPQFPAEHKTSWDTRVSQATLLNVFKRTISGMTGLVFRSEPTLANDNSGTLTDLWENIDNAGTHGSVFLKKVFQAALRDGHAVILVEMPRNIATNAAEQKSLNLRPYWTLREASQVMNWQAANINGREVLTQITFKEETCEPAGRFLTKEVTRYRVYTRTDAGVFVETWIEQKTKDGKTEVVPEVEPQRIDVSEIPVAIVYGNQEELLTSEPPLLDLALVNIRHFQDYSDYRTGKQKAALITPYAVNRAIAPGQEGQPVIIGFDAFVDLEENGSFGYAEPQGNALEAHRVALEDTKKEMAWLGIAALMPTSENTATKSTPEATMDNAASTSELATIARSLQDAAELALSFLAQYAKVEGGSLQLGVAWQDLVLSVDQQQIYMDLNATGKLSLDTMWGIFHRAHLLGEDFDAEAERSKLASVDVIPTEGQ